MNIENYFDSDDFFDAIEPIKNKFDATNSMKNIELIEKFIGNGIKYYLLFKDDENFSINDLNEYIVNLADYISDPQLGSIDYWTFRDYNDKVFIEKFYNTQSNKEITDTLPSYLFHAFNSSEYESIKQYGLDPKRKLTPQKDIDEINDIFIKHGITTIFGWQKIDCENKIFCARNPNTLYDYGVRSPEWFSQFTGGSLAHTNNTKNRIQGAYMNNDYNAAKYNLTSIMNGKNFSDDEKQIVFDFFEKNWNLYANKNPMAVIIPYPSENYNYGNIFKNISYYLADNTDYRSPKVVDTSEAIFLKLPTYSKLIKKMIFDQNNENSNEEISSKETTLKNLLFLSQLDINKINDDLSKDSSITTNYSIDVLKKIKEIINDKEVYKVIISNKDNKDFDRYISVFNKEIINEPENIKLLALNKPWYLNNISEENISNLELMKECAAQAGIDPIITCYVSKEIQNNFDFIATVIANTNKDTFDFNYNNHFIPQRSNFSYNESIGIDVRANPKFWQLLNDKIKDINSQTNSPIVLFDIDRELSLVEQEILDKNSNNIEHKTHNI